MDPRSNSLADVLRRTAARDGGKVALIEGEVRQTYAELDAEANRVANALAARGVRPGRPRRAAVAQLPRVRRRRLRRREARRGPRCR